MTKLVKASESTNMSPLQLKIFDALKGWFICDYPICAYRVNNQTLKEEYREIAHLRIDFKGKIIKAVSRIDVYNRYLVSIEDINISKGTLYDILNLDLMPSIDVLQDEITRAFAAFAEETHLAA